MKVGDLVRFKQHDSPLIRRPPVDLKIVVEIKGRKNSNFDSSNYAIIYYLQGPRTGQKSPCDINRLEVVSESR